jgi:hypothetical protein
MTTDNFCFCLQKRLIKTSQTVGQWYNDTPPLVFAGQTVTNALAYYVSELFTAVKVFTVQAAA